MFRLKLVVLLLLSIAQSSSILNAQTVINFNDDGTFQIPSYSEGGVSVTGSNLLDFTDGTFGGIGVVGDDDSLVDNFESLFFMAEGATQFTSFDLNTALGFDGNNNGMINDFRVEAYDASGASLGVIVDFANGGLGTNEYLALLGLTQAKVIEIASEGDGFNARSISVSFVTVPEPNSIGMLLACCAGIAFRRRR